MYINLTLTRIASEVSVYKESGGSCRHCKRWIDLKRIALPESQNVHVEHIVKVSSVFIYVKEAESVPLGPPTLRRLEKTEDAHLHTGIGSADEPTGDLD